MSFTYIACSAKTNFDTLAYPSAPFGVLIVDPVIQSPDVQWTLSQALVKAGCINMGAWGPDSTQWDDAVDNACILFPDRRLRPEIIDTLTWWIDKDPIEDAVAFLINDQDIPIDQLLIIEFGSEFGEARLREISETPT